VFNGGKNRYRLADGAGEEGAASSGRDPGLENHEIDSASETDTDYIEVSIQSQFNKRTL
jgi:hypothetical protein